MNNNIKTPHFELEKSAVLNGLEPVVGIDEAGRGALCGPVVAAAVSFYEMSLVAGLDDSKKVPANERIRIFNVIQSVATVGVGIVDVDYIDEHNILNATMKAMELAVYDMGIQAGAVIVDGDKRPNVNCPCMPVVGGDSISASVSAASIIAKVARDEIMVELHKEFPQYGWDKNKGYGTKEHLQAIEKYGATPHHRKSFKPMRDM